MIACPSCGCPTSVTETRSIGPQRVRRRRRCDALACGARITTVEVLLDEVSKGHQQLVVAPRKALQQAFTALGAALGHDFGAVVVEKEPAE